MAAQNDTIYIDIDDEITGVIDKVKASSSKVVTLVLPKRAAVFQSSVNMKLLKRAADGDKKQVILVTSEAGLLPLAGAAGLYVAKTLSSTPAIPDAPDFDGTTEESVNDAGQELSDPAIDPSQPISVIDGNEEKSPKVARDAAVAAGAAAGIETIALAADDDDAADANQGSGSGSGAISSQAAKSAEAPKPKKDKSKKIPNFERFRLILVGFAVLLVVLIAGFFFLNSSLAKATITIKTNASTVPVNANLYLSTTATSLNLDGSAVPAKYVTLQKTYTESVPTTGQKNNGNQAAGSVTMSDDVCGGGFPQDVPEGSGVTANGQTYITQSDTSFSLTGTHGKGNCSTYQANADTPITAQNGGASGNTPANTPFAVADRSDVSATGQATGGTDNIQQTVNQNDVNNAKAKISTNNTAAMQTLDTEIKAAGNYPINATFSSGNPTVTTSPPVGSAATTVSVTEVVTYSIFSVSQNNMTALLDNNISGQINTSKQSILDDGLSSASFNVVTQSTTNANVTLTTKAIVGPDLSVATIKQSAAKQKAGAIQGQISNYPGVTSVNVKFSPFWVDTAPSNTSKITVVIAKPTS